MKTFSYLFIAFAFMVSACSSTNQSVKNTTDDVYYSSKDSQKEIEDKKAKLAAAAEASRIKKTNAENYSTQSDNSSQVADDYYDPNAKASTSTTNDAAGNTYVTNNYNDNSFDYDDYYDYAYSSRIRRFHNQSTYFGYYDPFYTDAYYYNYQPNCWGTSIYSSYNFWSPTTTIVIGNTWGYNPWRPYGYFGYNSWGYNPWYGYNYNPYGNGFGYGYGGYWNGYNNGYANGYWDGYNQGFNNGYFGNNYYYYNSFERKETYYGPRNSSASNGTGSPGRGRDSFGDKFERAVKADRGNEMELNTNTEGRPRRNDDAIGNDNSGKPRTISTNGDAVVAPGKGKTTEIENTGRPNYTNTKGDAVDSPGKGKSNTIENTGRPNNWTTKGDEIPVKGKTNEMNTGDGRPAYSNPKNNGIQEPIRGTNNSGEGRPSNNWNNNNNPRTNTETAPVRGNNENAGPRNTSPNTTSPVRPNFENTTPRPNENAAPRTNPSKRNEDAPINVQPQRRDEGRPKRGAFESSPRQEQRPTFEQPRQESPRYQQNNSAPVQRESNTNGGGGRRR